MSRNNKESRRLLKVIADLVAIGAQATGFFIWPIVEFGRGHTKTWTVPVAVLLISFGWWENYVDRRSPIGLVKRLGRVKDRLLKTRYFVYSFVSIFKILCFFCSMLLFLHFQSFNVKTLFSQFSEAFSAHTINVTQLHGQNSFGSFGNVVPDIPGKY